MLLTVGWRLVIAVWGIAVHGIKVARGPTAGQTLMHLGWPADPLTYLADAGVRQDAFWYARIVEHGYTFSTHHLSSIVFYPLFPLLLKGFSLVTGNVFVAGVVLPTLCLFVSVWLLQQWLEDRGLGDRTPVVTGLILCFPFAFFWVSMYNESLFLALTLATFVLFERRRPLPAALCAFAAVLCRPTGLIIAPVLAVMILESNRCSKCRELRAACRPTAWLAVLAGPLAFATFVAYQWLRFVTPLASVRAEAVPPFSRGFSQALSDLMLNRHGFPPWFLLFMLAFGVVFLAAVPTVYRRFGLAYALFAALVVLFPMTSGLTSLERYVMIDFPVFAAVATAAPRRLTLVLMTLGFYGLLGFMTLFIAGYTII
jgi:hypothetical protein